MNIIKVTNRMLMLLFLLLSFNVSAKSVDHLEIAEVLELEIKLSNDGTGIIKGIPCTNCKTKYLRITKKSKAAVNDKDVSIQLAKKRAGKNVGISFDPKTREVVYIFWYER